MEKGMQTTSIAYVDLLDWRRSVAEMYAAVRADEDPERAWAAWRQRRDALFGDHPQSPLSEAAKAAFEGLDYFDYDPSLRLEAELIALDGGRTEKLYVGDDGTVSLSPIARTDGLRSRLGGELTLYWIGGYGGGVFLPFLDATSGATTYPGGRYLLDTIKGADLGIRPDRPAVLDFNFAYNPSCSYSERWVCPLSPVGNRLPEPVWAGEKSPL